MCQLLFNLLDERTDAGFHQQIENMGYDLDLWLERELGAKLRPAGFDDALEYLGERRGLWGLLKKMFAKNPMMRIKSKAALAQFEEVCEIHLFSLRKNLFIFINSHLCSISSS